jgi:hypothetical protein
VLVVENTKVDGKCADPPTMTPVANVTVLTTLLVSGASTDASRVCLTPYAPMENRYYVSVVANTAMDGVCAYPPTVATRPQTLSTSPISSTMPVSTRIWTTSALLTSIPSIPLVSHSLPASLSAKLVTSAGMSGFVWPTRFISVGV